MPTIMALLLILYKVNLGTPLCRSIWLGFRCAVSCLSGKEKNNVFTSFIATLLDGGGTANSALRLPLNIQTKENAVCNIKKYSGMAKVLQNCHIIIWDECILAHTH